LRARGLDAARPNRGDPAAAKGECARILPDPRGGRRADYARRVGAQSVVARRIAFWDRRALSTGLDLARPIDFRVVEDRTDDVLAAAERRAPRSGTATVQCALPTSRW